MVAFLLERATVHTHYGFDKLARADLEQAAEQRAFKFALTGLLGKRTKFQQKETSQLVVLARSAEQQTSRSTGEDRGSIPKSTSADFSSATKPKTLDLNDDTLLESIAFSEKPVSSVDVKDAHSLPSELVELDPDDQPLLEPLDSIILLLLASSITNTSPSNGLTREETAPYAARVLEGGSSNWQIYTQALLIRSRIEGYRSRTVERGLLQLQALVDQVIADTSSPESKNGSTSTEATTFLPRPKDGESAPVQQRLLYIYQLCSPMRWELEAELAARWISLGGLRSAVEIYQRLELWAELALCWAATDRDDKARKIVRKQLFHSINDESDAIDEDAEKWEGEPRDPPPTDAPRLYCILGDLDKDPSFYEKAWETSNGRYYRAQRSLGRYWYGQRDYVKASAAYSKAVKVKQLDHPTWFALGCALLELDQFSKAAEAFTRAVQLDDGDAESWSNLAAALLHIEPEELAKASLAEKVPSEAVDDPEDADDSSLLTTQDLRDPQKNRKDALKALKQAARLKRDNYRIWDNLLTVAASLHPPSFTDVITAQQRIIDLRGKTDGEKCVDVDVLDALVRHVTSHQLNSSEDSDPTRPGLSRMVCRLVDGSVIPLITSSARLWYIVARLALWRDKPSTSLDANEKAWRAVAGSGWEYGTPAQWDTVVDATESLVAAYESLGPRERTEGLGAGAGELVCKTWKFKIRSAVRGILGRAKSSWEGTEGWRRLSEIGEAAKGSQS
jgi:tetratricopeptide (TPR) repeat protein